MTAAPPRTIARLGDIASRFYHPPAVYPTIVEAEWLMLHVDSGGAITQTPGDTYIRTYLSLYGAVGLVKAYEVTGNPHYLAAAWGFAAWYRDHMDGTTGYVDDYTVGYDLTTGVPTYTDTGNKDSTDAYAGMYLTLLWSLYRADVNGATDILPYAASISLALTAIESTQQIDGLTYALPTYDVKYLEDNVEALYGARCAQSLAWVIGGNATSALYVRAKADADNLARGIGIMWDWETQVWDYAIHASGYFARNDWSDDNARRQQMWATGWGEVVTPLAGAQVLAAYLAAFPTWASQSSSGNYEPMALWAYRRAGDVGTATAQANVIETNGVANGRGYPWTCQTSGLMIIGQYGFTAGMDGTGADGLPIPALTFPDGTNFITNPGFVDSNSDGLPDTLSNYNNPGNSVLPLTNGQNAYQMVIPNSDAYAAQWPTFDLSAEGGTWYCFSIYKLTTYLSDPVNSKIVMTWEAHDSSDNLITYSYSFFPNVDTDGVFKRIWISFLVPTTGTPYAKVHLSIGFQNGPGTFILASPKFEKAGASPTAMPLGVPVLTTPPTISTNIPFTDTFNRADGLLGEPWHGISMSGGRYSISGNAVHDTNGVSGDKVGVTINAADMDVTAVVLTLPATDTYVSLLARCTDAANYYELQIVHDATNGTSLVLTGLSGGTGLGTLWAQTTPGAGLSTISVGDSVTLSVKGSTIVVRVNGTILHSLTNSSITTGNIAGISTGYFNTGTSTTMQTAALDSFAVTVATGLNFADNFNRADGAAGSPWYANAASDPTLVISSNKLVVSSNGVNNSLCLDLSADDFTVQWDWTFGVSGSHAQMLFRAPVGGGAERTGETYSQIAVSPNAFDGVTFYDVSGTSAPADTTGPAVLGLATPNTYTFKVVFSGTAYHCYLNGSGSPFLSGTAAPAASNRRTIEIQMTNTGYALDNLSITYP